MKTLNELLKQEETCLFDRFNNRTAWEIGRLAVERAEEEKLPVAINIDRFGQPLFHAALTGTGPDNDLWIAGKKRVVYHFRHSSFYISRRLLESGQNLKEKYYLDPGEFRARGGGFPILVKSAGLAGVLTVSGLKDNEDHDFAVRILHEYLSGPGS